MFANKIHAGGSKEISVPHSSVILVIHGNYSNSRTPRNIAMFVYNFFAFMQIRPSLVTLVGLNLV